MTSERIEIVRAARKGCERMLGQANLLRSEMVRVVEASDMALGTSHHELGESLHCLNTVVSASQHTAWALEALEDALLHEEAQR